MKYKTLFRLALKFLGVWLIVQSVCSAAAQLLSMATYPSNLEFVLWYVPIELARIAVGCYFFFGGKWVADLAIPSNRRYCPECAYELYGLLAAQCPECGTPTTQENAAPPNAT